ncbi:MAG: glycosyl transferase, partial [Pseudomonadota bacterium]
GAWFRQRTRWIKGYIQTWVVHSRYMPRSWRHAMTLHLVVGGVVIAALINPVFWALYILWVTGLVDLNRLFPAPLGALATFGFLAGNLMLLWLYMLAPMRRRWHDLVPYALTAPAYWLMQTAAGYKAVWQFATRPHYWEKTEHGEGARLQDISEKDLEAAS